MATRDPLNTALFAERVAFGEQELIAPLHKFGAAVDVGTSLTVIATAEVYQTPAPDGAVSLEILSSDNTNDIPAGTGAREVTLIGQGPGFVEQTVTVALNGTTPVAIDGDWLRLYRGYVSGAGHYATAASPTHNSTITVRVPGPGDTWMTIIPEDAYGLGQSQVAAFTVPAGYRGWLVERTITVQSTKSATVILFQRPNADTNEAPFSAMRSVFINRGVAGTDHKIYKVPIGPFVGPCDIGYLGKADATTASISVNFDMYIERLPS